LELLRFYAELYVRLGKELKTLQNCLYMDEGKRRNLKPGEVVEPTFQTDWTGLVIPILNRAKNAFEKLKLVVTAIHAGELLVAAEQQSLTAADVEALHENMDRELSTRFFVGIPEERKAEFCESRKGWEDIAQTFPRSIDDIEEMNKCFALCRYSAAVFHSLLVVEHGLVELGQLLGVTDPKEGWDASCRKLEAIVKAGHNANATKLDFNFLDQLNACAQVMKLAWRNKVNHATGRIIVMSGGFAPYITEEIMVTTRGFMRRLAEGIK
jgi:hypothetical protein